MPQPPRQKPDIAQAPPADPHAGHDMAETGGEGGMQYPLYNPFRRHVNKCIMVHVSFGQQHRYVRKSS